MHIQAIPVTLIAGAFIAAALIARARTLLPLPIGFPASRPVAAG